MSSSLFPLNMLPVITSIQPCCDCLLRTSMELMESDGPEKEIGSDSRLIFACFSVDPDPVALVDEGRHLDDDTRFERRGLDLRARRRALDARNGFLHDEINGRWQLDADRLGPV